ncbi:MAG: Na+/H+ antiporter subunit E [Burkholderiales bacterium]|nr:Na+/H+ antiporter subunit E [Burkholderiales bacterium]
MSFPRTLALFALWLVLLPSAAPGDLALGVCAALGAAWVSVRLAPRGSARMRWMALLAYAPHFFLYSVSAALDVARRAFSPDMRLKPGYVDYETGFARGFARNTFATITSLMPGSLPCAERDRTLEYHALDAAAPVAAQLGEEEAELREALGGRDSG